MTRLLERAFREVAQLPVVQQDEIAGWLLAELQAEKRWDLLLADTQDVLELLADEALAEHSAGKTKLAMVIV